MKIAIVGAGIGGLTAAALLEEHGHEVKVFEKKASLSEVSAGTSLKSWVIMILLKGLKTLGKI